LTQLNSTNLVYYDWEITEDRLPQVRSLTDFLFVLSGSGQQFIAADAPAQKWLDAVAPKLGNCGTVGTIVSSNEVALVRNGSIGLTAFELTMLKGWIASPNFPLSARMDRVRPSLRNRATNAVVPMPAPGAVQKSNSTN
jgi:hypothetical protein